MSWKKFNVVYKENNRQMNKRLHPPLFLMKGDLRIIKYYRGISLTDRTAKICDAYLLTHIWPEVEKILRKDQIGFWKNQSIISQILTIHQIIEGIQAKNLETILFFVDFSKAFDSIQEKRWSKYFSSMFF